VFKAEHDASARNLFVEMPRRSSSTMYCLNFVKKKSFDFKFILLMLRKRYKQNTENVKYIITTIKGHKRYFSLKPRISEALLLYGEVDKT
jgi:hypothetical protein